MEPSQGIKNTMKEKKNEKKMEVALPGFEPAPLLSPAQKCQASNHWAMRPMRKIP